jgi:hypothetical protein
MLVGLKNIVFFSTQSTYFASFVYRSQEYAVVFNSTCFISISLTLGFEQLKSRQKFHTKFRVCKSVHHHIGCFKNSFTNLKAYRNLYRGHTQRFEPSKCSKTHRGLLRIVIRNCFDLFLQFLLHGISSVTVHRPGKRVLRYSRTSPR